MDRERLGKKFPIVVVNYDPGWTLLYEEEARILQSEFGPSLIMRIEHFGSTAVPGLAAKPVIDILVEIPSFEAAEREMLPKLEAMGYGQEWYEKQKPRGEHMALWKGYFPELDQKYHLHMAPGDHALMERLLFRDYLRKHPDVAKEYQELKYHLAREHQFDREAYTGAKSSFVEVITVKAIQEFGRSAS